jgi:hypothetical protein
MVSRRDGFCGLAALAAAVIGCSSSVQGTGGTGGSSSTTSSAVTTGAGGATTSASTGTGGAGGGGTTTTTGAGGSSTTTTTTTTTGAGGSSSGDCAPLPGAFALRKLYFGDTNPDGTPNVVNGWKQYGVNIDGKVSTAASVDLCQPISNGSKLKVYPDGNDGIDNSFGKNVLPIFLGIFADFSTQSNQGIASGAFTFLLDLEGLGAAPDQGPIVARYYEGSTLPMSPSFDGSDCWPVTPSSLVNPLNFASAKTVFPQSTLAQDHWSSASVADLSLSLFLQGFVVPLKIHHARIEMTLSPAHDGVAHGVIGGVLDTQELSQAIKQMAGSFDPSLCMGPTIDSIIAQIEQASDILVDGSQNPALPCNGISIGIGFDTGAVQLGAIGPDEPAPPNPCGP